MRSARFQFRTRGPNQYRSLASSISGEMRLLYLHIVYPQKRLDGYLSSLRGSMALLTALHESIQSSTTMHDVASRRNIAGGASASEREQTHANYHSTKASKQIFKHP